MVGIPGEDLLDDCCLDRVDSDPAGITRAFWVQDIAIGRTGPGEQLPTA
jgi:hypothetical protein